MAVSDKELDDAANATGVPVAEAVASNEIPPAPIETPPAPVIAEAPPAASELPPAVVTPPLPESEDNTERSKLGRKVAAMERQFSEFMGEFRGFIEQSKKPVEAGEPPELPTTPQELETFLEQREAKRTEATRRYESGYLKTTLQLGEDLGEDEHKQVMDEMMAHFNVKRTGDPGIDAQMNYREAERSILRKRLASQTPPARVNPLKGEAPKGPLGVSGEVRVETHAPKPFELDAIAQDFVKQTGMTEEQVRRSLTGTAPTYLGR